MQVIKFVRNTVLLVSLVSVAASCNPFKAKKEKSTATGWNYNDQQYGNFNVIKPKDIKTAPGLGFVQGGTFTMGSRQENFKAALNNFSHR